ncbi:hypothetical protein LXA43DRAFT_946878 [Ganoderma leucocontextum]|nr:hypothetical protein LXA43DRAFT_946878 [Ganoderma leucocontextum]
MSGTSLVGVNDILHHIVSHLAADLDVPTPESPRFELDDSESEAARQALAQLARAHSTFAQPALAALWRHLPSDEALKHLLCVVGIAHRPPELCGTPATHPSSWTRFQEYASLVRAITIDPSVHTFEFPSKLLQGTFWSQLSSALGDWPILPRLEAATLFSLNPFCLLDFDMGALCLLTPSLRELNVIFPGVGRGEQSNFRRVLSACLPAGHNLEALSVVVPVPVLDIEPLPQLYPRLRHLKIDEDGIHPNHLALLATLPNLEYLSIILTPYALPNLPIAFAQLRGLEVFSYSFIGIGLLIVHVDAPQLRSLSISETHPDSSETFPQELSNHLRTLVRKHPFLSAFRWVSRDLSSAGFGDAGRADRTLAGLLDPLLSLRAMRDFSASFTRPLIPYSLTDFRKIAEAWPDIETFYLSVTGSGADQFADLESLASFARHCPHLRKLRIPRVKFDPDASTPVVGAPTPHLLRELNVGSVILPTDQFEDATSQGRVLSARV